MTEIVQLTEVDETILEQINTLIAQLARTPLVLEMSDIERAMQNPNVELWIVREEEKIVGMGAVVAVIMFTNKYAHLDEVVIDKAQRGRGLGEALLKKLIGRAKALGAKGLELTSGLDREAANKLYQKLGFEIRETNVYRLKF